MGHGMALTLRPVADRQEVGSQVMHDSTDKVLCLRTVVAGVLRRSCSMSGARREKEFYVSGNRIASVIGILSLLGGYRGCRKATTVSVKR
jgi:hypothetical protein